MNSKELVKLFKQSFQVLPTKNEIKKFILERNVSCNKSTEEISNLLVTAYQVRDYRIKQRKPRMTKNITKEEIEKLVNEGYYHYEIAKKLGISTGKLTALKKKYELVQARVTSINIEELREYMKFHTQTEAAKKFRRDQSAISQIMKKYDIKDKRDFCKLWLELKKKIDNVEILQLMKELEN